MQANGRGSHKGRFGKIGSFILGAVIFTAGHAQAVPFTGASQGFFTSTPISGPDGTVAFYLQTTTTHGYTTTGGAFMCHETMSHFELVSEPTGACGMEEVEIATTTSGYCQHESTEDIFNSTLTSTTCVPYSCYDENNIPQAGCSFTFTGSATATGGSGIAAGLSGSWMSSGTGTYMQVEVTDFGGLLITATLSAEIEGDTELADGSVAPAGAALEIPSPGTNVSGIGLISGWSCLGGELEVEFSDAEGVIGTAPVRHGTDRLDTLERCDDRNNGFSSTFNWSNLGAGEKTARLIRNGEEVDSSTFMVTAFDRPFLPPEVEGMCTITNFPDMSQNATFVWETSQQGLVLDSVN